MRSRVSSSGSRSLSIASITAAGVGIVDSMLKPADAREQQRGRAGQQDEGDAAGAEGDADAEERREGADLQLPERGEADGHDPGAAGPASQVARHAQLQQALREQVRERADGD